MSNFSTCCLTLMYNIIDEDAYIFLIRIDIKKNLSLLCILIIQYIENDWKINCESGYQFILGCSHDGIVQEANIKLTNEVKNHISITIELYFKLQREPSLKI